MSSGPGYAKHPNHKIHLEPCAQTCEVRVQGKLLASSSNCLIMKEGSYPEVVYFPFAELPQERLLASKTETYCPFKGTASYWHLSGTQSPATPQIDDILWSYQNPYDEMQAIQGYVAFYADKVDAIARR